MTFIPWSLILSLSLSPNLNLICSSSASSSCHITCQRPQSLFLFIFLISTYLLNLTYPSSSTALACKSEKKLLSIIPICIFSRPVFGDATLLQIVIFDISMLWRKMQCRNLDLERVRYNCDKYAKCKMQKKLDSWNNCDVQSIIFSLWCSHRPLAVTPIRGTPGIPTYNIQSQQNISTMRWRSESISVTCWVNKMWFEGSVANACFFDLRSPSNTS